MYLAYEPESGGSGRRGAAALRRARSAAWKALLGAAFVVAAAGPARVARAQAEQVESLIRQGVELRKQGKDALALPFFENAYQKSRNPRTAAQLGLGEMALGYWVEAQRHLGEAVEATDNPWVKKNARMLSDSLAKVRSMVGELTITGEPAGADVTINGQPMGKARRRTWPAGARSTICSPSGTPTASARRFGSARTSAATG